MTLHAQSPPNYSWQDDSFFQENKTASDFGRIEESCEEALETVEDQDGRFASGSP